MCDDPFAGGCTVITRTVQELVNWFASEGVYRLRLPPIQRSLVWRNNQIVNYWDSLLRGYPAGTMMVVRVTAGAMGRDETNSTKKADEDEYHLLDGQQRLFAILLGMDRGPLAETRRLWIDPDAEFTELKLGLRVNSTGNPFGYVANDPNTKPRVEDRRKALNAWSEGKGQTKMLMPQHIFADLKHKPEVTLIGCDKALSLASLLSKEARDTSSSLTSEQRELLNQALSVPVIVCLCPKSVLGEDDYSRFFARIGQGGTRLTDDELVYSQIKQLVPKVHDQVVAIAKVAQLVTPVHLVLAALRVVKSVTDATKQSDRERISRPMPEFVRKPEFKCILKTFESMLDSKGEGANLLRMTTTLNQLLRYSGQKDAVDAGAACEAQPANPLGLPAMLMADLSAPLFDVLLLLAYRHHGTEWAPEERTALIAFVLYWLVFCRDPGKAATSVYRTLCGTQATAELPLPLRFSPQVASRLICDIEIEGAADLAPWQPDMEAAYRAVESYGATLRDWNSRFATNPTDKECRGIRALRVITTNRQRWKRLLMWVQRQYLDSFSYYDPTSVHDDDLPFDLDHLIPHSLFGANAQTFQGKLKDISCEEIERLLEHRRLFGNSLGNFRWLFFSDNRARGDDEIKEIVEQISNGDAVSSRPTGAQENVCAFNKLINAYKDQGWNKDELTAFQKLIDKRALDLIAFFLKASTLSELLESAVLPSDST